MSESKFFCFGKNDFCTDYKSPDACLHCGKMNGNGGEMRPVPEPSRLDRTAWESCAKCKTCDNCVHSGDYDPYEGYFGECASCDLKTHSNFSPENFCHHCGRPLTDDAWEMLERRIRNEE